MQIGLVTNQLSLSNLGRKQSDMQGDGNKALFQMVLTNASMERQINEQSIEGAAQDLLQKIHALLKELGLTEQPSELKKLIIDQLKHEDAENVQLIELLNSSASIDQLLESISVEATNSSNGIAGMMSELSSFKSHPLGEMQHLPQQGRMAQNQDTAALLTTSEAKHLLRLLDSVVKHVKQRTSSEKEDFPRLVGERQTSFATKLSATSPTKLTSIPLAGELGNKTMDSNLSNSQFTISQLEQYKLYVGTEKVAENQFVQEFESIIQKGKFQTTRNGNMQLQIKLFPEHLGKLEITIIEKNGEMIARINATTQAAKELIESQLHQLKQSFQSQNLNVEKIEIQQRNIETYTQQDDRNGSQQEEHKEEQQKRKSITHEEHESEEESFASFLDEMNVVI